MRQAMVIAALLFLSAGLAFGADHDKAREHFVKGTRAYELGLYDEAIAEYMAAYKLKDDPAFLFNLGQAHRLAKHPAEALRFYKTYLAKVPGASNRAEVEAKMAEMTQMLEQQSQPAPAEAPEHPPAASPPETASPPSAPPAVEPAAAPVPIEISHPAATSTPPAGQGLRLGGIVTAAGGVALLGTGIVFAVIAKQAADELSQLDENRGVFDPSKENAGRRDQVLAAVFIGAGAAAIATGTVLYVLGAREGQPQSLVISPSVTAHSAGAMLRAVF